MEDMEWKLYNFESLSVDLLYDLLKLRQDIFIIEQDCMYADIDGLDKVSAHLICTLKGRVCGCLRIVPPGEKFTEPSLGRIAVDKNFRGKKAGKTLIERGVGHCRELYGVRPIRIEAQQYLETYYTRLGFETDSKPYDLDGIPHIQMVIS